MGNEAYKKKEFETALLHYNKAVELDPTDITYLNNIAGIAPYAFFCFLLSCFGMPCSTLYHLFPAVYFEQKEYKKCIEQCEKAIDIGRENRADFKLIAKAFTRIGNAYKKLEVIWTILQY